MARPYFQTEQQEHELRRLIRTEVARRLRACYEATVREPLPDRLATLVENLDDCRE